MVVAGLFLLLGILLVAPSARSKGNREGERPPFPTLSAELSVVERNYGGQDQDRRALSSDCAAVSITGCEEVHDSYTHLTLPTTPNV